MPGLFFMWSAVASEGRHRLLRYNIPAYQRLVKRTQATRKHSQSESCHASLKRGNSFSSVVLRGAEKRTPRRCRENRHPANDDKAWPIESVGNGSAIVARRQKQ